MERDGRLLREGEKQGGEEGKESVVVEVKVKVEGRQVEEGRVSVVVKEGVTLTGNLR